MVTFPQLIEAHRLQYMQALGVTSWLPTQSFSGSLYNDVRWQHEDPMAAQVALETAATTRLGDLQRNVKPAVDSESSASLVSSNRVSHHQTQAVTAALGGLGAKVEVVPTNTVELSVSASVDANMAAINLAPMHLGLSWYTNGVLVINDVPIQDGAAMSSPIQRLQTAIVNALSGADSQFMPFATAEFNWPLVPGPHGDHSLAGAKIGLAYSLGKLLQDKACHKVLLMGPAPVQLLQPQLELGKASLLELASQSVPMVYSHSLHQLLAVPSLKADTWVHLQPLLVSE